jgi:hypothetical protein
VQTLWKFIRDNLSTHAPEGVLNFSTNYTLDLSGQSPQATLDNFDLQILDLGVQVLGDDQL